MYRILLFLILSLYLVSYSIAQQKKICISLDDIPAVTYGDRDPYIKEKIIDSLLATFDRFNIPAIGFVVESQLYNHGETNSSHVALLEKWLARGYDLGNHTYSHHDYNRVSDSSYFEDILNGEKITTSLLKKYGKPIKYFRHPYLHTGADAAQNASLKKFLKQNNYLVSPVTIDNSDYLFAKAYFHAYDRQDQAMMLKIGQAYINYMEKKLIYFEQKSRVVFGRNITQTLLIHGSLLNSHYLDELAKMYIRNGYSFVSQAVALEDPAYSSTINSYSKSGNSWIFRWGLSQGMGKELMEGDILTPEWIIELARN